MKKWTIYIFLITKFINSIFSQEINVVTENWPPYNYEQDSKIVGLGTEIVEATLKQTDLKYNISILPWARAYMIAQKDKNTLIYSISRTKEREELFRWIGPFAKRTVYLYKLKSRTDIKIEELNHVKDYVIGLVKGDSMHQFFTRHGFTEEKNMDTVVLEEQNIKKLFVGRVDFITSNELSLAHKLDELGYDFNQLEKVLLLVDDGGYYMALNRETSNYITEKIKAGFEEIKNNGTLDRINSKYSSK